MKSLKLGFLILASTGLVLLGGLSNSNQAAQISKSLSGSTLILAKDQSSNHGDSHGKNAQVVENGAYHLEFVPEKEANGTHLDFYLQKGDNHEAIPNAKVTAQVQSPDGKQKSIPLSYDASGKHYTAVLPGNAAGQYQVKVTADIGGKKVDGRFSFKQ
ncbi:hypothetical protein DP113_33335 (plasmid) [Brasilonema octagenarum UFV-E1]|uniref:Uncharacterized protein n=2 Tax=Brasilonema TaxID=383614 RepID=A0A856MR37_9CYAN|nr:MULTISPECIES: hypothetical protein [Brasilonema]NMF61686.1 hypothetical protein [Brasilonema octagenarum UFV-OR1]QDL12620.1 hypothetical protein DP114_33230 [Brasilonema sennae CENA114]QDL19015.1 hypothetical protein DP113_33335 [Brasilonema octagenarum UFV-E1]